MKQKIESLIHKIKNGEISDAEILNLIDSIKISIKEDATKGRELGELLRNIKQASGNKIVKTGVNWVKVNKGFLGIGHKPGGKISFDGLKKEGITHLITLLKENEDALSIGKQAKNINIVWIWFPFSASKSHEDEMISEVYDLYNQLEVLLNQEIKIYIHCSAGIHRTGMITYGLLRFLKIEKAEASKILKSLREVTFSQVGEDRLIWGDQFYKVKQ